MALATASKLGPYEIIAPAGAGGMGEVYRARDTRLDRRVAIKILPEAFAADANRLRRFEQESQAVAALSHPNIVAIYDVGVHEGLPYLVMEFLEGKTLRERLNEGPLPVSKAVEYAQQVARGLAAAHERGIIHRDLKPENVFLSKDGFAKLLDFGLAKAQATVSAHDATLASQTSPGVVLGTAGYMSPEQVRGEAVDARSDIFSFGTTLYEMLGGKRAFTGDTSVEVMMAILRSDPPEFDPEMKVSPGLERIVRHCLEKNPADRFQTARDLTFALTALSGTDSSSVVRAAKSAVPKRWIPLTITSLACLAILLAAFLILRPKGPAARRQEFAIPVLGEVAYLGISADGEMMAYVAPDENTGLGILYVQPVGELAARKLDDTEGATYPFFSPDHKYIAFFAAGKLKKIPVEGGTPQTLANVTSARGGSWGSQNIILFAADAGGPLMRINADGTNLKQATNYAFSASEVSNRFPVFLPDGNSYIFWAGNFDELSDDRVSGLYLSSLTRSDRTLITNARSSPGYSDGDLFYVNEGALMALPIDKNGTAKGQPRIIASSVGRYPSTYWGNFAVAAKGTVIYGVGTGAPTSQLTWYDRSGKELGTIGEPGILANPKLSPDDDWVAVDIIDLKSHNIDVWLQNLLQHTMSRFTFLPAEETNAIWSRDGSMIAFRSGGRRRLSVKGARGLGAEKQLLDTTHTGDPIPNQWTPDNKQVLVTSQDAKGGSDIELVDSQNGKVTPLLDSPASETNGQISPDGKWIIYASDESGDWEVYATSFPTPGGKIQISRGEGTEPRWGPSGKEIFYVGPHRMLTVTSFNMQATLSTSAPQPLFQLRGRAPISSTDIFTYDISKDGKRFLVNRYIKPSSVPPLNIVLNSTAQ